MTRLTFRQIEDEIGRLMTIPRAELDAVEQADFAEYMEYLRESSAEKVDGFCRFVKAQQALMDHKREEAQRLYKEAAAIEGNLLWLKEEYLAVMRKHNLAQVCGNAYKISKRNNDFVVILDEERIPPDYVKERYERKVDKALIRAALKDGVDVEGAALGQSQSLIIR